MLEIHEALGRREFDGCMVQTAIRCDDVIEPSSRERTSAFPRGGRMAHHPQGVITVVIFFVVGLLIAVIAKALVPGRDPSLARAGRE
jgi:hypothetical protein